MSDSRNVVRSRFFGQPNLSMMCFQFLAYLSQKAIVQGFKSEKTLRLKKMEYPIPTDSKNDHFHLCSVFHFFFFSKRWEFANSKAQKSAGFALKSPKVRASERPSVSRGWLQWLVYFLFLKLIALGASSLADFFTLRKCPLDSRKKRGRTILVD